MLNKCNFFFLRSNEIKFTVEQILLHKYIERNIVQAPLLVSYGTPYEIVRELLIRVRRIK